MRRFLVIPVVLGLLFMVGCYQAPVSSPSDGTTNPTNSNGVAGLEDSEDESEVILPSRESPEDVTWISPGKVWVGAIITYLTSDIDEEVTIIEVIDTSEFPKSGRLILDKELIYYGKKTRTSFMDIIRGPVAKEHKIQSMVISNDVGNFYAGARAEWLLSIHNGNDIETSFSVKYRYPDHVDVGYVKPPSEVQDWVVISDNTPVLMPKETRDILVVLAMPKDAAVFALKWEFWISVKDTTQTGMVQTELCTRWLITMRP